VRVKASVRVSVGMIVRLSVRVGRVSHLKAF
jgi:hypothetical protein